MNCQEGIISHFTRRLDLVINRIDNTCISSILEKQLNEELGNGDIKKNHKMIFENFIAGLEQYQERENTSEMLVPAYKLSQQLEAIYSDSNPYIGVGAAIMMEIRGEQRDIIVNKELARTNLDKSVVAWFHLHEKLENDHAEEVTALAFEIDRLDVDKDAVLQGLKITSKALWDFCNGMYRVCYGT